MKTYLILALLILASCGSRKVAIDISKSSTVQEATTNEQATTSQTTQSKATEANTSAETNTSEGERVTSIKRYDKTTGVLVSEKNVVDKRKRSGTKQATSTRTFEQTDFKLTDMRRTITTHLTVKTLDKNKNSDTNNKPLYWMLFGVGVVGILVYGGYKLLTNR